MKFNTPFMQMASYNAYEYIYNICIYKYNVYIYINIPKLTTHIIQFCAIIKIFFSESRLWIIKQIIFFYINTN